LPLEPVPDSLEPVPDSLEPVPDGVAPAGQPKAAGRDQRAAWDRVAVAAPAHPPGADFGANQLPDGTTVVVVPVGSEPADRDLLRAELRRCRQLTEARAEHQWLAAGSQTVQQQALRDLDQRFTVDVLAENTAIRALLHHVGVVTACRADDYYLSLAISLCLASAAGGARSELGK
jgi:hypothetical protein